MQDVGDHVMIKCLLPRSTDIILKTTHHMLGIY